MSLYSIVKKVYKILFPKAVQNLTYKYMPNWLKVMRNSFIRRLAKSAEFDEIYDGNYFFKGEDPVYEKSCQVIAENIVKVFSDADSNTYGNAWADDILGRLRGWRRGRLDNKRFGERQERRRL